MAPMTVFCPNGHYHARGQTGIDTSGIHSRKEQRFICPECHKTFSARKGTVCLLSAAHLGRDRGHRGDLARPRMSHASDCDGVGGRRAHHSGLVGPCGSSGPSGARVSGQ
jgi:hypothetical protein